MPFSFLALIPMYIYSHCFAQKNKIWDACMHAFVIYIYVGRQLYWLCKSFFFRKSVPLVSIPATPQTSQSAASVYQTTSSAQVTLTCMHVCTCIYSFCMYMYMHMWMWYHVKWHLFYNVDIGQSFTWFLYLYTPTAKTFVWFILNM